MVTLKELSAAELKSFRRDLKENISGKVSFDQITRGLYSTDASIYRITPKAVVIPVDESDVCNTVKIAAEYGVSILPRGGGTSLAGQTVGPSVVINFVKHLNKILEINPEEQWIRVQPGIVRDELNAAVAKYGLYFPIDLSTGNRANIGGMIGNDSSGTRSILYGKTVDYILETKNLLTNGNIINFSSLTPEEYEKEMKKNDVKGEILRRFKEILDYNREEIIKQYPKKARRVIGYNLDEFIKSDKWNLSKLITGSEGTLTTLLEAKLNLVPLPKKSGLCVAHFNYLPEAINAVKPILKHGPSAVEIIDKTITTLVHENRGLGRKSDFIEGDPEAILIIEFCGDSEDTVRAKISELVKDLKSMGLGYSYPEKLDAVSQSNVWQVRKEGLGIMLNVPGNRKPVAFIEDASVPIDALPEYIEEIQKICNRHDTRTALYAHASVGVIHVRPFLDLRQQIDIDRMKAIAEETFQIVKKYEGALSAEHGDGLARSPFMERYFGTQIYQAFKDIKTLFDPDNLMNPGKIVNAPPMDQNLKYGVNYKPQKWDSVYHYRKNNGFISEVELCIGIGACHKTLQGTMCPSYIATRDEEHSTRGRANALRLAISGQFGENGITSKRLFEIMDLCLSCKACKSECPSNVDMAKLKSEFLQKYFDKHGVPLRERLVGASDDMAAFFSGWSAPFVNYIQKTFLFRKILEWTAGFDSRRMLPEYTSTPFYKWLENRKNNSINSDKKIVLYDDPYMNYYQPNIGIAAVELLESCGYEVIPALAGNPQRPRISNGLLRDAKFHGTKTLQNLDSYIQKGLKIVVCEPSCASALTDDLPDLVDDAEMAKRIQENVSMIDVFLDKEINSGNLKCRFTSPYKKIYIHAHCHQESLYGIKSMKTLLSQIPEVIVENFDSGCCGMAGSFGHEKEHYDLSMKIAENRLFKQIRNMPEDGVLIACGFSCRHQIMDGTGVKALHWVETIRGTHP